MLEKIYDFPINISTDFSSETGIGPCPPLSTVVDFKKTGMDGYNNTISTSGVWDALQRHDKENIFSVVSKGTGKKIATKDTLSANNVLVKKIKILSNRINITEPDDGGLIIDYNTSDLFPVVRSEYIQGGVYQMESNFNGKDNFEETDNVIPPNTQSNIFIPILANISGSSDWNSNIAIDKIGIKILSGSPFLNNGEIISLGTKDDPEKFGSFTTRNQTNIEKFGEWVSFTYSDEMLKRGYLFFTSEDEIIATTKTSVHIVRDTISKLFSSFRVRIFFDKVYFRPIENMKGYQLGSGNTQGIIFDNETSFVLNVGVKVKRNFGTGLSNNIKGLCFGGSEDTSNVTSNVIDGIIFDTDSEVTSQKVLTEPCKNMVGVYSHMGKGYLLGGVKTTATLDTYSIYSFSSDSVIKSTNHLTKPIKNGAGVFCDGDGYTLGGTNTSPESTTINKVNFYTDDITILAETFTKPTTNNTGISSEEIGYTMGGSISNKKVNTINGLKFDTETMLNNISSTLSSAKYYGGGVFSQTEGYYLGGTNTTETTDIDKLDFATQSCIKMSSTLFYNNTQAGYKASAQYYPKMGRKGFPYTFPQILA
jgi:hypothetical protein